VKTRAIISVPGKRGNLHGWFPASHTEAATIGEAESWCRAELTRYAVADCKINLVIDEDLGISTWASNVNKSAGRINHRRRSIYANEA
jgi:hypothetical protein